MYCGESLECVQVSGVEGGRNIRVAGVGSTVRAAICTDAAGRSRFHLIIVLCVTWSGLCVNGSRHGLGLQMCSVVKVDVVCRAGCCVLNVFSCAGSMCFSNCGFGNDESLQMTVGSHGQD